GEYLPGSLQGKISSDGCLKKRTNGSVRYCQYTSVTCFIKLNCDKMAIEKVQLTYPDSVVARW
ncbi:hypothetical protein ACVTME_21930, partial [Escherichia coli]